MKLQRWSPHPLVRDASCNDIDDDATDAGDEEVGDALAAAEPRLRGVLSSASWHTPCAGPVWHQRF